MSTRASCSEDHWLLNVQGFPSQDHDTFIVVMTAVGTHGGGHVRKPYATGPSFPVALQGDSANQKHQFSC